MAKRVKVGITLTEETLRRLNILCTNNGLSKSQAISLTINTYVNKYLNLEQLENKKGE